MKTRNRSDHPEYLITSIYGKNEWISLINHYSKEKIQNSIEQVIKIKVKNERNISIFMEYFTNNITYVELATRHNITKQRISEIILTIMKMLQTVECYTYFKIYLDYDCSLDYLLGYIAGYEKAIGNKTDDIFARTSIEELNLSDRAHNILKRNNIFTVDKIIMLGRPGLRKINGLGKTICDEICNKLYEFFNIMM